MSRAAEHLIGETEAYMVAQQVIGTIEETLAEWRNGGLTVGELLAQIAHLGLHSRRAMDKGWDFLDERPIQ